MSLCQVQAGKTIFKQGSFGNFFYFLKEGSVELHIDNKFIKNLKETESFGEMALLHGAPRSATIKAKTDCLLWCLERKTFRKIVEHISQLNFEENKSFVESINILANMDNDQKQILCSNLIKEIYEKGDKIVKMGDQANCIYIIKEGIVGCFKDGERVRELTKGDVFGERSILTETVRSLDVIAEESVTCFSISIETLRTMVGDSYRDVLFKNCLKLAFLKSEIFGSINGSMIDDSYKFFKLKEYNEGEVILDKDHIMSSDLIVVLEGGIKNNKGKEVAVRNAILFEKDVFNGTKDKLADVYVASPDCLLMKIESKIFQKQLGGSFDSLLSKSSLLESLAKVPLFKNFNHRKLEELSKVVQEVQFFDKDKIIKEGEEGDKFYIIKSGKIDIHVKGNYIRSLSTNQYFGERALFFKEPRSATATATNDVVCYVVEKSDFLNLLEENLKQYLEKKLFLQDNTVEMKDLECFSELGSGNYGNVCLVQSKKNKFFYAIKSIAKTQIDSEQLHENLDLERSILLQIDHPFIVKLVKTLKDTKYIYFLMEYIKGKELFDVIRDIGLLNKFQTQFYGASMLNSIEYLHSKKFVYRDIKPENILVTETGFIKVIDFGTAKAIVDRTTTIIGTPHYMAPEVILGEGYTFNVDYWSIAICLYEFVCGGVPFGETADDPMDVYLAIINEY